MEFPGISTFYELLEIRSDATPEQIRDAYLRIKATYGKDNVALYSLVDGEDSKEALARLEEAYAVLSHPDKRRDYDQLHGVWKTETWATQPQSKIVSIDRVPPMEENASEQLLVAPSTDLSPHSQAQAGYDPIQIEIEREIEWSGAFLKRVRETKKISIEEMSNVTRVSKTYLQALEDENYGKLPAAVFIRGFITQIAKTLKIPHEKVVAAYMARHQKSGFDKTR